MIRRLPACTCLLLAAAPALGQTRDDEAEKAFRAVRTATPPIVDGRLDEEIWGLADVVEDFHEINPDEYDEPTQRTQVFVLYDEDNLYIAAKLWDTEPEGITAQILRQGSGIGNDDNFGVILDPFHDRRSGYRFQVNPNGVRAEAIYQNTTQTQSNWQGIWQAEARIVEGGWTLEMAIPYKTLSFNPANDTWGINFTRKIARNDETIGWVSRTRAQNPGVAGIAIGLDGLEQGRGLDIVPSLSMQGSKDYAPGTSATDTEPSMDIFYKFTPAMTGVLTFNTDFSATEVDDRQVNLTRFSLFFPEKRDFFLQDADIFEFGSIGGTNNFRGGDQNGRPFFSRTIGLSASRQPVGLDVGGKLTGRIGPWSLGVLNIEQEEFEDVDATSLFVGRGVLNVLEESNIGVIVTDGDPQSNLDNTLIGVDFRYRSTRIPGRRTLTGETWYQQSDTPGLDGDDSAFGVGLRLSAPDKFSGNLDYKELQDNFNPALGFANRVGIREYSAGVNYTHRPRDKFLRALAGGPSFSRSERLADGSLQSESLSLSLRFFDHTNDSINFSCKRQKEGLVDPFTILRRRPPEPNVVISPGLYEFDSCSGSVRSGNQRKFAAGFTYESGEFYDGNRDSTRSNFNWRPSSHFALSMSYQVNDIEVSDGALTTRLTQLTTEVVFSSTLSWVNLIQWDNGSDILGINSRLHWVPEAGRDFYLVLNHALEDLDENGTFHSTRGDLTAKASYTFRF
ncbi:MAG: carbohydrate binding family 9 domain-containing protein [Proteobacteria bacterium]|nr:carbohydrate binding family 9 domain-containing protein [Pseudomonadota bacterium]